MQNKYLEGNIKIAKFVGAAQIAEYKGEKGGYFNSQIFDFRIKDDDENSYPNNQRYWSDLNLRYHKEYNWLMPVVEILSDAKKCEDKIPLRAFAYFHNKLYDDVLKTSFSLPKLWELVVNTIDIIDRK